MDREEAVQELAARLVAVVNKSDVPIVVADANQSDLPLIICNAAFCNLSGYALDEMLGRNCRFMQPATGVGPVKGRMQEFLNDDTQSQAEFIVPNARKDGSRFLNLLHLSKITKPNYAPLVIGSQFDITTHSDQELQAYRSTLSHDMALMKELAHRQGWVLDLPDASLGESLVRISEIQRPE